MEDVFTLIGTNGAKSESFHLLDVSPDDETNPLASQLP